MDDTITEIHITTGLSSSKIIELIDNYPNLNKITCSKSIYNRISKTYIDALNELGIDVVIKYNWGAKPKYQKEEKRIFSLAKDGFSANDISKKLEIPKNRVYYLLSKNKENFKLNNYRRKHDLNKRKLVKSMRKEGESPKNIASKLNIPLRSVYYILNKK